MSVNKCVYFCVYMNVFLCVCIYGVFPNVPMPYSIGWNIPECRSTKMCRHSERPQGSRMGMTRVGRAVSMNAETQRQPYHEKDH